MPTLFEGSVRVPEEAASGKAKITVSFPDWGKDHVAPATFEIPVLEPEPKGESAVKGRGP